jgi:hypothetical protein
MLQRTGRTAAKEDHGAMLNAPSSVGVAVDVCIGSI